MEFIAFAILKNSLQVKQQCVGAARQDMK